jgi:hypothetical protein
MKLARCAADIFRIAIVVFTLIGSHAGYLGVVEVMKINCQLMTLCAIGTTLSMWLENIAGNKWMHEENKGYYARLSQQ